MKRFIVLGIFFMLVSCAFSQGEKDENSAGIENGTIWFMSDPSLIEVKKFDKEKASTNFTLQNDLYARIFLEEPMQKIFKHLKLTYDFNSEINKYNYALRFYVDNELKLQWLDEMPEKDFTYATTKAFTLASSNKQLQQRYSSIINEWADLVINLKPGEHKIQINMVPLTHNSVDDNLPVIATGKFTLNVNREDLKSFRAKKIPGLPEATLKSPELEEDILIASKAVFINGVPVQAIITDVKGGWTYEKDEDNNIVGRQIVASVVYAFPTENRCFIKTGLYYQSHQGNGIYDKTIFVKEVHGYFDYAIDCNEIKE